MGWEIWNWRILIHSSEFLTRYPPVWLDAGVHVCHNVYTFPPSSLPHRIFFSTFFGGSTLDWASKQDTSTYFKNLQVRTDCLLSVRNS
jgi:hypothetical protein